MADDRGLSSSAVNERLRQFIVEHREAQAKGDPRAFRESDVLLAAMCEQALEAQAKAALYRAELERRMLAQHGGRMQ